MARQRSLFAFALSGLIALAGGHAGVDAKDALPGPVGARVLRVLDGDTLEVRARIWLGQEVQTQVRLSGVDAPELRGGCRFERDLARRARAHLVARLISADGKPAHVRLYDIGIGKYGGRVVARVVTAGGEDLGDGLLAAGLARPYAGRSRHSWCAAAG